MAKLVLATQAFKQRRYDAAVNDLSKLNDTTFEGITGAILKAWAQVGENKLAAAFKSLDELADGGLEDFLVFHRAIMAGVARRLADAIKTQDALDAIVQFESQVSTHPIITEVKTALANKQLPGPYADSA